MLHSAQSFCPLTPSHACCLRVLSTLPPKPSPVATLQQQVVTANPSPVATLQVQQVSAEPSPVATLKVQKVDAGPSPVATLEVQKPVRRASALDLAANAPKPKPPAKPSPVSFA